jgi:uncharacterized protein
MTNWRKHGVSFRLAATVFRDPLALSRYDFEHSQSEERWITLGQAETGQLAVVVHTFEELAAEARIRIISARYATARERRIRAADSFHASRRSHHARRVRLFER